MNRFNFNKLFDEFFSGNDFLNLNQFLSNDIDTEKKIYTNDDGSVNVVYIRGGNKFEKNEINTLRQKLDFAVETQDFELAVELRDKIKNLEQNQEEIKKLNDELNSHIKNQDFEKCIELRDKIRTLKDVKN